jgi:hypothetical protein
MMCFSGFWRRVDSPADAKVSEKRTVSIFRAEEARRPPLCKVKGKMRKGGEQKKKKKNEEKRKEVGKKEGRINRMRSKRTRGRRRMKKITGRSPVVCLLTFQSSDCRGQRE